MVIIYELKELVVKGSRLNNSIVTFDKRISENLRYARDRDDFKYIQNMSKNYLLNFNEINLEQGEKNLSNQLNYMNESDSMFLKNLEVVSSDINSEINSYGYNSHNDVERIYNRFHDSELVKCA